MSDEQKRIGDLEIIGRNLLTIAKDFLSSLGPCEHDVNICVCELKEQIEVAEEILVGNYYHPWGIQKGDHYRCDKCGRIYHASQNSYRCTTCGASHPFRIQHEN